MYRLPLLIILIGWSNLYGQSPHGTNFKIDCFTCHNTDSWIIDEKNSKFDHTSTGFELSGMHESIQCIDCHSDLVFEKINQDCIECHRDIHKMTVGSDCLRCHQTNNWLVDDINLLHTENGFPLLGAHFSLDCIDCHTTIQELEFRRLGNECIECHQQEFQSAIPDHQQLGYSINCTECHSGDGFSWTAQDIDHSFFPLELGHDNLQCVDCHGSINFQGLNPDCFSCHESDYQSAMNPVHQSSAFPTDCKLCHTLDIDWMPASFNSHDTEFFPIYSGNHKNEWNACTDCHINPQNFSFFSCIDCHEHQNKAEVDNEHRGVNGYIFQSNACYACHPKGEED